MRVAEITTRIVRVLEVPRSQLGEFLKMPEALQVGVYFLIGELSESDLPRVYIGQSGNVGKRLVQHNQDTDRGKDFWNRALVVVSLTNSMTQTHALFFGRALQPGERQRGRAAPHARAARGRLPRDPRDRRHPAGHAGPADF
jgi:predicted GIY-YIG superfamily endonuclease